MPFFALSNSPCLDFEALGVTWLKPLSGHATLSFRPSSYPQVDPDAFAALQDCIYSGNFDTCESVPAGDPNGFLINPLGGISVDMSGPAG